MSRKILALLLAVLLALCLSGACAESTSVTVTDMYGREITLSQPAERIVALTPSDCEILCALGGESLLVGRGAYCDYPETIAAVRCGDQHRGNPRARAAGGAHERHVPDDGTGRHA